MSHSLISRDSDLADAFPNGEYAEAFRADWLTAMAKEVRSNREFQQRTQDTARWAREQIKRQIGRNAFTPFRFSTPEFPSPASSTNSIRYIPSQH